MATPRIDWNQIVSGKRPRNTASLRGLQDTLWKLLRVAEAGVYHHIETGETDLAVRFLNSTVILGARCHALLLDLDLSERLDALLDRHNASRRELLGEGDEIHTEADSARNGAHRA